MSILVLLRHGQSQWNLENRFTGWKDIGLSENGILEAKDSGRLIKDKKIPIDIVYSSGLKRAIDTAIIAMKEANYDHLFNDGELIIIKNIAVNERDYGDLTGLNKKETAEKYGKEQVHIWRRSYDTQPPNGESLKDVVERVGPYYEKNIQPLINEKKNVIIVAHGNSLRATMIKVGLYKPEEISSIELPTGRPFCIVFADNKLEDSFYLS